MAPNVAKKIANKVIAYAFTAGVVIALILGLIAGWLPETVLPYLTTLMIVAGVIVGFANIRPAEAKEYVWFVTALAIVIYLGMNNLGEVLWIGDYVKAVMGTHHAHRGHCWLKSNN